MPGWVVQSVSVAANGVSPGYVTRDAADWQVPVVHLHPCLNIGHHVSVRVEPDTEVVVHPHDAVLRASGVHQLPAAATVYAASCRGTESRCRLLTGTQRASAF